MILKRLSIVLFTVWPLSAQVAKWDVGIAPWQLFATGPMTAASVAGASLAASRGASSPPQATGGVAGPSVPATLRVTASRQPLAVLRAVAGQAPEGMALYIGRVCALSATRQVDPGEIEQAIEGSGVAISTRPLAQAAVQRSRGRTLSVLARIGEAAQWVGPVVLGLAAGGSIELPTWGIAGVGALSSGLRLAQEASAGERGRVTASLGDLGLWLSDMPTVVLNGGQCSPRFMFAGSYRPDVVTLVGEIP